MTSLIQILLMILNVVWWIVIIHVIMSWLINFQVLNLRQPLVGQVWDGLNRLLNPIYSRIRRFLPDMGGLDLAPLIVLLAIYALGLGIPFLLVAAFFPRLKGLMGFLKRHMDRIERVMGLLLWTIGLLMLTGGFGQFSYWLLETFPGLAQLG